MRDFAIMLVKIVKSHPCQKWSRALPNLMKPNQNAQTASIYMQQKGLSGCLLISVLFLCIITAFYRQVEQKVVKMTLYDLIDLSKDLVLCRSDLLSKMWFLWPKTLIEIKLPPQHLTLSNCNLIPIKLCLTYLISN